MFYYPLPVFVFFPTVFLHISLFNLFISRRVFKSSLVSPFPFCVSSVPLPVPQSYWVPCVSPMLDGYQLITEAGFFVVQPACFYV